MDISRTPGERLAGTIRVMAGLALLLAGGAAVEGCARSSAEPPRTAPTGRNAPAADAGGSPATSAERPPVADPSEEITPEELGTIPEPVPSQSRGAHYPDPRSTPRAPQTAPEGASRRTGKDSGPGESLWRVQVFATEDRDLAAHTAFEASILLGAKAHVAHEASHYKVRLGDYRSEEEAGALRDMAVRSGYPGAFRIRCKADTTLNND
jgi:hypothetical protein